MDRTIKIFSNLNSASSDTTDSPPIPAGKILVVSRIGGLDINVGNNRSSFYLFQWGTVGAFSIFGAISVTGATMEIALREQLVGNGSKFIRITRQNNELVATPAKRCPCWIKGYDQ